MWTWGQEESGAALYNLPGVSFLARREPPGFCRHPGNK